MCYHVNQSSLDFDEEYKVTIPKNWAKSAAERFHINGFAHSNLGVVANDKPNELQEMEWGLVPFWVKSAEKAADIGNKTLNAKAETIFELPSFRDTILKRRCIIPVAGFYEWRHYKRKTYPYFIHPEGTVVFHLAGIWEEWTDKDSGEIRRTCSIITTEANLLMAQIHNTKKRMPLILDLGKAKKWIEPNLGKEEIKKLMNPISTKKMNAHTIRRLVTSRTEDSNLEEVTGKAEYAELPEMEF